MSLNAEKAEAMAARSAVELDFFRMEKDCSPKPLPNNKLFDRRRSFRDIQGFISKMNPELLKTVIASGSVDQSANLSKSSENGNFMASMTSFSVPATPKRDENLFPALPVYVPPFRSNTCGSDHCSRESAPLTIFYNGTVATFDVNRHKAENILKLAEEGGSKTVESTNPELALASSTDQHRLLETLKGGQSLSNLSFCPLTRGMSLQRFLEKRKERLTVELSPYGRPTHHAFSGKNSSAYED